MYPLSGIRGTGPSVRSPPGATGLGHLRARAGPERGRRAPCSAAAHTAGDVVPAVCGSPRLLAGWASWDRTVLTVLWLGPPEHGAKGTQRSSRDAFDGAGLGTPLHHSHNALLVTQLIPIPLGGRGEKGDTRRWQPLGSFGS